MWKNKYKFGIETIDQQHEELFSRVSEFLFSLRENRNWEDTVLKVKETLEFMQSYVVVHIEAEELYQKEIDYPGLRMHKEMHDQIKVEVFNFGQRFNDEEYNKDLVQKLASWLLALLIKHVGICDREIAYFARECMDSKVYRFE